MPFIILSSLRKRRTGAPKDHRSKYAVTFASSSIPVPSVSSWLIPLAIGAADYLFGHRSLPAPGRGYCSWLGPAGKFRADRSGTSAVEFAIIAAPFFAILLGTLELALIFIVNTGVNVGAEALATQIRTGQIQAPGLAATSSSGVQLDLADAKTQLCNQIQIVSSATCMQQLQIDVRPLTSFQTTSSTSPVSGKTFNSSNLCFYSGNAGDVVEMRVYYLYPLIDPLLSYAFANITSYTSSNGTWSGNYYPIQATQVFKSENYSGETNSGAGC